MSYTEDEYFDMLESYQSQQDDMFRGNPDDFKTVSLADMKFSDNENVFGIFKNEINRQNVLHIKFGIDDGTCYYQLTYNSKDYRLYLNKLIVNYIYQWLISGEIASAPTTSEPDKNMGEQYRLHLLKYDRQNNFNHYDSKTGEYKSIFKKGSINYGKLPYTPQELDAKLKSLS